MYDKIKLWVSCLLIIFVPGILCAYDASYSGAQVDAEIARSAGRNTVIADPGSDDELVTEQAVREALDLKQDILTEGAFEDGDKTNLDNQSGTNTGDNSANTTYTIGSKTQAYDAMLDDISALVDPDADRLGFWDDSAGEWVWLTLGTNLSITDTTINATGGTGEGDLKADGTVPLTANWDIGAYTITGTRFISDIAIGTAPFGVTSTTVVPNLNVSQLLGQTWAIPGTIGGTTPGTVNATTVSAGAGGFTVDAAGNTVVKSLTNGATATPTMALDDSDSLDADTTIITIGANATTVTAGAVVSDLIFSYKDGGDASGAFSEAFRIDGSINQVEFLIPADGTFNLDASGFDGNLTITDDTLQEVAQAFDDMTTAGVETKDTGWTIIDLDTAVAVADGVQAYLIPPSWNGLDLVTFTAKVRKPGATGTTDIQIVRERIGDRMGDATSQFDLTDQTGDVCRITYDSTGTDPGITTTTLNVGDYVQISGFTTSANDGFFELTTVAADYIQFTNDSLSAEADQTGITIIPVRRREMLSTVATIDSSEWSTTTAATTYVIDTDNDDLLTDDLLLINVEAISTTAPEGLSATIEGR